MKNYFILVWFIVSILPISYLEAESNKESKVTVENQTTNKKLTSLSFKFNQLRSDLRDLKSNLSDINENIQDKFCDPSEIQSRLNSIASNISTIETRLKNKSSEMSFETFSGILLSAVSVIVTVLGVIIALLAFWGFRNIKLTAIDASVDASEKKINEAISSGRFNDLIEKSIGYVAYKDVMSEHSQFIDDDEEVEEEL